MRLLPVFAWSLLAAVAFVTLAPIGFRPDSGFSPNLERFATFGAVGFAFALAYPRHIWLTVTLVLGAALAFEVLQLLVQSRHARLPDLVFKLVGGSLGITLGLVARRLWERMSKGLAG
jgi:glycopeptide antibiotics resistance protein